MGREGSTDRSIRAVVVDDDDLFRVGLRALLHTAGIDVVADARVGDEATAVAARLVPDVVLLGLDGSRLARAATRRLAEVAPAAKVIVLTDAPEPNDVVDALAAGASGYVAKNDSIETIVAGIVRAAAAGEPLLSTRTTHALIDRLRALSAQCVRGEVLEGELSPRELQVLVLLAEGHDNRQIANLLFISPHTVKHHVRTICDKLGAQNRVQAAVRAARAGLV